MGKDRKAIIIVFGICAILYFIGQIDFEKFLASDVPTVKNAFIGFIIIVALIIYALKNNKRTLERDIRAAKKINEEKIKESKRIAARESNPWHARSYEEILDFDNLSFITWQDLPNYAGQYVFNIETKRPVRVYGDNLFPEYEDEYGIRHPFEYSDFIDKKTWAKLPERKDKIVGRSIEEAIKDGLPESLIPDEYKAVR